MSGDPEQGYFSDGITEDIITDLGKVSALRVTARNTVFTFKGQAVDVATVARQLSVSHVLEGSVRKAGGRVRITAQLIDGTSGDHVWAERYDRDLTDIFELQDEISKAIVAALRLKLLPEEKRAIEQRGTTNLEAFNLYLMARQHYITGNMTDRAKSETVIRLCRRAIELDPDYARAWAQLAVGQRMALYGGREGDNGLAAAERALALDDSLADAHAARAAVLLGAGAHDEARREVETAFRLDLDCYEANHTAGKLCFAQGRHREAIDFWEKASEVMESDFSATGMLITCYTAIGDIEGARHAARRTLARTEKIIEEDPGNGSAISMMVGALANLGELERAKTWSDRALLMDPDNLNMRYNLACTLIFDLKAFDVGLDILAPALEGFSKDRLEHARVDPDLDPVRDHARFKAMLAEAEARLAAGGA
jgi:adenylate cyclase